MKSRFHEAADAELADAIRYYDDKVTGLGDRFLAEVKAATARIEQYPEIAQVIDLGVRAKVLLSFSVQPHVRCGPRRAIYRRGRTSQQATGLPG